MVKSLLNNHMKKLITLLVFTIFIANNDIYSQCPNGGLENGNMDGWDLFESDGNYFSKPRDHYNQDLDEMRYTTSYETGQVGSLFTGSLNYLASPGPDVNFPQLNAVDNGAYALIVGDPTAGGKAGQGGSAGASYKITVTEQNKIFTFRYAIVMEDPDLTAKWYNLSHIGNSNPKVRWFMTKGNRVKPNKSSREEMDLYDATKREFVADASDPYFKIGKGTNPHTNDEREFVYRDWSCARFDLSDYVGETLRFNIISTDCKPGKHFAKVLVDGLCEQNIATPFMDLPRTVCGESDIILDASETMNEEHYRIAVVETNYDGSEIYGKPLYAEAFLFQTAGEINLTNWIEGKGGKFECGKTYKVLLSVTNQCGEWAHVQKLVSINCPNIELGPDLTLCCPADDGPQASIRIETEENGPYTYEWRKAGGAVINVPAGQAYVEIPRPTTDEIIILTAWDNLGCRADDFKYVRVARPFEVDLELHDIGDNLDCSVGSCAKDQAFESPQYCGPYVSTNTRVYDDCASNHTEITNPYELSKLSYSWWNSAEGFTNVSGSVTEVPAAATAMSVTVSNGCPEMDQVADLRGIQGDDYYDYNLSELELAPTNALNPYASALRNRRHIITEQRDVSELDPLYDRAYHSYRYKMVILNRWGSIVKCIEGCDPRGFHNGDIYWDGRNSKGDLVAEDVYSWKVRFWNCRSGQWGREEFDHWYLEPVCHGEWEWFLGGFFLTKKCEGLLVDELRKRENVDAGSVTVTYRDFPD